MKIILIFICFVSLQVFSQPDSIIQPNNAYGFRIIPSAKENIFGVCMGLVGSETICNIPYVKKSHGINIQLFGQGFFVFLNRKAFSFKQSLDAEKGFLRGISDSSFYKAKHNGIIFSTFGTFTDVINGVSMSAGASMGFLMNGLSINLFTSKYGQVNGVILAMFNQAHDMSGLQIGLVNKTNELHGFQIGLWNVNSKRKLPLINWSF